MDLLLGIAVVVAWVILARWVLPRAGVPT